MVLEIRRPSPQETPRFAQVLLAATGEPPSSDATADFAEGCDAERSLVALSGGDVVAATGSEPLELTLPGSRMVPATRITHTGVLPTHRRQGLARRLLGEQLRDLSERGEQLAIFTTTGPGHYRDIGYAPATWVVEAEVETASVARPAVDLRPVRLLPAHDLAATLPPIFERHRASQPGQVRRTDRFWQRWLLDKPQHRDPGAGARVAALVPGTDGVGEGYLTYRLEAGHPHDQPVERLLVEDLVATTPAAWAALWSYCLGFRQARVVRASHLPVDDPLPWLVTDVRALRFLRVREFLWLRLIDVGAALSARAFASGELVLEVRDASLPQNAGRYYLASDGHESVCRRASDRADLRLDAADLAAAYLGGARFSALHRAGRVAELTAGAIPRADGMFLSSPMPWTVSAW